MAVAYNLHMHAYSNISLLDKELSGPIHTITDQLFLRFTKSPPAHRYVKSTRDVCFLKLKAMMPPLKYR